MRKQQQFVQRHLMRSPNGLFQPRFKSRQVLVRQPILAQQPVLPPQFALPTSNPTIAPPVPPTVPAPILPRDTAIPESEHISTNVNTATLAGNENIVPPNETMEEKAKRLKALRLKCMVPDVENFMNDKTAQCYEGLEFKFPFISCNTDFCAACLWCKQYFNVPTSALNCKIFRHAYHRVGTSEWQLGPMINPHASKTTIDALKKNNQILGCGGAMYYDGSILRAVGFNT